MDELTRWNTIFDIIYKGILILGIVSGFVARKHIGRLIQRMMSGLFNALESIFYTVAEWWNPWGRRFTIIVVIIVVLSAGVYYLATKPGLLGQTSASLHLPAQTYSTDAPGPRCDKGSGQWKQDNQLLLTCLTNRVGLTYTGDGSDIYELFFGGSDTTHNLFANTYSVHIMVTFPDASDAYVGIGVHGIASKAICGQMAWVQPSNAAWILYRYEPDGSDAPLDNGPVTTSASTYTLDIAVQGALITLYVNNVFATQLTDSTFQTTSYVCIGMGGSQNDTVTVSDFEFTPHS